MGLASTMDSKISGSYTHGMATARSSLAPAGTGGDAVNLQRVHRHSPKKVAAEGTNVTSYSFLLQGMLYQAR